MKRMWEAEYEITVGGNDHARPSRSGGRRDREPDRGPSPAGWMVFGIVVGLLSLAMMVIMSAAGG